MTPLQLNHLLAIVEHGSLGRAAVHLNISEPALSRSVRNLELELGVTLMDRHASGMKPTIYGEALSNHARIIRTEFARAVLHIGELQGASQGHVAVGASHSFARALLPQATARLLAAKPGIRISVTHGLFHALVPLLLRAELDFLLMPLRDHAPSDELGQIVLRTERSAFLVRAGHPLAGRPDVALDDLWAYSWMLPKPGDRLRVWLDERLAQLGYGPATPAVEFDSVIYARALLTETDLIGFLPLEPVRMYLDSGRMAVLPIPEAEWIRQAGILYRTQNTLTPAAQVLIDELRAHPDESSG